MREDVVVISRKLFMEMYINLRATQIMFLIQEGKGDEDLDLLFKKIESEIPNFEPIKQIGDEVEKKEIAKKKTSRCSNERLGNRMKCIMFMLLGIIIGIIFMLIFSVILCERRRK